MSKGELNWMSRISIYTPPHKIQPLHTDPAKFDTTGRIGARHRTRRCTETYRFEKLVVTTSLDADLRPVSTHRTRPVRKSPVWMHSGLHRMLPALRPVETLCSVWSIKLCHNCYNASTGRAGARTVQRPVDALLLMPWTNWTPPCVRCSTNQRPVHIKAPRSLPIQATLWTTSTSLDLWANPEVPSAKFDKCAPHLNC
jgi:hypothetical protein